MTLLPGVFLWRGPIASGGGAMHTREAGKHRAPPTPRAEASLHNARMCPNPSLSTSFLFLWGAYLLVGSPPPLQT